jgi:hypothetical protein
MKRIVMLAALAAALTVASPAPADAKRFVLKRADARAHVANSYRAGTAQGVLAPSAPDTVQQARSLVARTRFASRVNRRTVDVPVVFVGVLDGVLQAQAGTVRVYAYPAPHAPGYWAVYSELVATSD